jgi:hypothetical protein
MKDQELTSSGNDLGRGSTGAVPTPREIWAAREPLSETVWAVCPYLRDGKDCNRCPAWGPEEHEGEKCQRGCYALAAEACRVVATLQLTPTSPPHDHRLEGLGSSSVRSEPGSTDWRPIHSAPKDGTLILIHRTEQRYAEDTHHVARWVAEDEWWQVHDGKFDHALRGDEPTHWMPLPEPPEGV